MKKILFIPTNNWASWGGSEKLWVELAKYLNQHEQIAIGISIKKWSNLNPELLNLYKISTVVERDFSLSLSGRIFEKIKNKLVSTNKNETHLKNFTKVFKPELVIISQGANTDGLEWMELCHKLNLPYITISQAATEAIWPSPDIAERLNAAFQQARLNLFVSEANQQLTEFQIAGKLSNAKVISNPYNIPFENNLKFPELINGNYTIACVARFELHAKGQDVLLATLASKKWKERNLLVRLYGDGIDKNTIAKQIQMLGIADKVQIMGYTKPIEIWESNQALILPSRYEGLPLALVEAMLCGRFGIVTDVSGNTEVIEDNVSGFIAAAPKAKYLDEALERAWQRKEEWETIGNTAKTTIKKMVPANPIATIAELLLSTKPNTV